MGFDFKTVFSSSGAEKLKAAFAGALEPALIFASTGSKSAAIWGGMKAVILNNVLGPMSLLSGAVLGVIGAVKLLVGNTEMLRKGMEKLKQVEFTQAQFKGLLGGVELARERVEELYDFANNTPFQMGQVAEASRMLQVLTKGALATTENLKIIGDAAATAGADFANVSMHVGRMYDGLQSGRPVGESAARLQELGLMSGQARAKIEEMTKAGNSFSETWRVVSEELKKNEGGMKTLSQTITGLETTLADAQDKMQAGFAKGFMEAEKESLERARDMAIALQAPLETLGEIFGSIAKVGSRIAGIFLKVAGGAKGLSDAIQFTIQSFIVFAAAIASAQIYTAVAGMRALTLAFIAGGKGSLYASTFVNVYKNGLKAAILSLKGMTIAQKLTGITAIATGGAFKLASFLVKQFTGALRAAFGAMLANPITALIAGLAALGAAIYQIVSAHNAEAEAGAKVSAATRELRDKYEEQAAAVTNMTEKTQLLTTMLESVSSAASEAGEALANVDAGIFVDEGLAAAEAMSNRVAAIVMDMKKAAEIDENRLRLSQARLDLLQRELDLQKALTKQNFDQAMSTANDAEKVSLLIQRRNELKESIQEAAGTNERQVASKEIDQRLEQRKTVKRAEIELEMGIRESSAEARRKRVEEGDDMEDVIEDWFATAEGEKALNEAKASGKYDRGTGERMFNALPTVALLNAASSPNEDTGVGKFNLDAFVKDLMNTDQFKADGVFGADKIAEEKKQMFKDLDIAMAKEREALTGTVGFDKSGNIDYTGVKDGMKLGAIESTLQSAARGEDEGGVNMTMRQVQALEAEKKALQANAKEYENMVKEQDQIIHQIEVIKANLQNAAAIRLIDTAEIEALRAITKETLDSEREKAEIMMRANKERIRAQEKSEAQGGGASRKRAGEDLAKMEEEAALLQAKLNKGDLGDVELEKTSKALVQVERDILELKGVLDTFDQAEQKTKKLADANKKLEDAIAKMDRTAIKAFNRLKEDLELLAMNNEIDFRFDIGDLSGAMDMMEALGKAEDSKFLERRTEELSKKMGDKEASEMAQRELAENKRAKSEQVQGNAAKARRAQDLAELELAARLGDSGAKKKATAMKDRDCLEASFRKNLGDSKDPLDIGTAKSAALSELMTQKLGEVPEMKTVTDGFRKIGAGGGAASTDPQVIMARKRTEALSALAQLTREMKGIQLDTKEVIDNRLNFDVK